MYEVVKVLNNNTILAHKDTEEVIIMYKGIGFGKKTGEHFEIPSQAKKYLMQKSYQTKNNVHDIINYIEPVYLEIAAEIH